MSESTDTDALIAQGRMITLAGGEQRCLRWNNRTVSKIEKRFAGISGYLAALRVNGIEAMATTLVILFRVPEDKAIDLVDARRQMDNYEAISESLVEFFDLDARRCPSCTKILPEGAAFCSSCGVKLSPGEAETQETDGQSPGQDSSTWPSSSSTSTPRPSGSE